MDDGGCLAVLWGGPRLNISYERMRWAGQHVFLHDKMRVIKQHCSGGYLESLPPLVDCLVATYGGLQDKSTHFKEIP